MIIYNAKLHTPNGSFDGWLRWENSKITALGEGAPPDEEQRIDAAGLHLLPGFIDVHVHGALGYDTMDASPEGLHKMAAFYARHGTTAFLPTTWTDSRERIMAALQNIKANLGTRPDGATILGAHLEGPYLNVEKTGAQHPHYVRRAMRDEAQAILDLDVIRLAAVAPEFEENHWFIEACRQRGITASVAHSSANYAQIQQAAALGISHSTHTFNAQTPLHHREPGIVGAVLTLPEITCELIADNIHVHPAVMQLLAMIKLPDHLVLISDAVQAAGMPEGEYHLDERTVIMKDNAVRLPDGTLAGSTLTMDRALYNLMCATQQPLEKLWRASSLIAARAIHVDDRKGSLEIGKDADLVLVDDEVAVRLTVAEGRVVYQKSM